MKKHILLMTLALTLASCEKKMSPSECQKNYNIARDRYDRAVADATSAYERHLYTFTQMQERIAIAASTANAHALSYEDCCCWTKL